MTDHSFSMRFPAGTLALAHLAPVANGQDRYVYFHPDYPDFLFKAPKPLEAALGLETGTPMSLGMADLKNFRRLMLKLAPRSLWHPFFKESDCYLRARLSGIASDDLPIPNLYGFCDSDIGPVLAVERVAMPDEMLGRTLKSIATKGELGPDKIDMLNQFTERMFRHAIIAGDMTAANIVLGQRGMNIQFVLIDGFGDIHAIPLRSLSARINRIAMIRSFRKMGGRIGLNFDEIRLRFSDRTV
ncbi:PhoP regulatory network YrbL family protein [Seohaeicola saemankumensis]|uniref:YrbL family protein n=1 Tax=Seohaeicola saemankumensis TaxID=481181 RepID=UPI001E2AFB50|nr:YrbL family protein [Seohaeicola saemankumensis]MCD1627068.1 PhoP regulatory network YrbL family protein [Seohaeicola saemankumensis]